MDLINQFIEKHEIKSSRQYQRKLLENPNSAPSMWFINQKYGSWKNLLVTDCRQKLFQTRNSSLEQLFIYFVSNF